MKDYTTSCLVDFQGRPIQRVVQLARVSGYSQEQEETIKTQISVMNAFGESRAWSVLDRYADEDTSNETPLSQRAEACRLWRALQAPEPPPFQAVLTYSVDRWSRHPPVFWPEYWHARQRGVRLISATQAIDDLTDEGLHLVLPVLIAVGSYDKSQIVKKLTAGRQRLLEDRYETGGQQYGFWLGGLAPYGYQQVEYRRRWILAIDDEPLPDRDYSPADVIRWIFVWVVEERLSARAVADRLNARQVPTYSQLPVERGRYSGRFKHGVPSGQWQTGQITHILHDTIYRGVHHYGKRPGNSRRVSAAGQPRPMPAIVSEPIWHAAQLALTQNQSWSDRNSHRHYLLRGLIKCGCCPYTFYGHVQYSRGVPVETNWYYTCRGASVKRRDLATLHGIECTTRSLRGPDLERHVLTLIQSFIDQPGHAIERLRIKLQAGVADTERLRVELDQLRAELAELGEQALRANRRFVTSNGRMTEKQLNALLDDITGDAERLGLQVAEREALLAQSRDAEQHLDTARRFLEEAQAQVGPVTSWSCERQRRIVERWVRAITVYPATETEEQQVSLDLWFSDPEVTAASSSHTLCRSYISIALGIEQFAAVCP